MIKQEKPIQSETIYEGKIFTVKKDTILLPENNQSATREVVLHHGGVCVAAKTNQNKYLLVKQYRYGVQEETLEFIAGKLNQNEDPFSAIKRELQEESGYQAKSWQDLGVTYPSPAYLSEKIYLYTASDLTYYKPQLDEDEFLEVVELSLDDILQKIENNEIKDLKTIALAYRLIQK